MRLLVRDRSAEPRHKCPRVSLGFGDNGMFGAQGLGFGAQGGGPRAIFWVLLCNDYDGDYELDEAETPDFQIRGSGILGLVRV